jgi:hypothetical protein
MNRSIGDSPALWKHLIAPLALSRVPENTPHFLSRIVQITPHAHPSPQCHINPRQRKVLERLLEAGHVGSAGGFLGGMTNEKYAKITGISKATATRDLADLLGQ